MHLAIYARAAALLALTFPVVAAAQEPVVTPPDLTFSGGVSLVSQYRFRGLALSDEKPALQGTINLNHKSGPYAGLWASSTDGFG